MEEAKDAPEAKVENHFLITTEGQRVELTATEARLLQLLLENPGQVFSREELLEGISEKAETPRLLTYTYTTLRRKHPG